MSSHCTRILQSCIRRRPGALLLRQLSSPTSSSSPPPLLACRLLSSSSSSPSMSTEREEEGGAAHPSSASSINPNSKKRGSRPKLPSKTQALLRARAEALKEEEAKAKEKGLTWRIRAACLIERHPIIMRDLEQWEADYAAVKEELLRHGMELPKETGIVGSDNIYDKTDEEVVKELPFKLAPRVTKADRLGDHTTLNRALSDHLFLLVRHKGGGQGGWDLPTAVWDGKQTMRKVHEGVIGRYLGDKFEAYIPSNAPIGFQWFTNNTKEGQGQHYGDKVFYYRSQHLRGRGAVLLAAAGVEEYVWVTKGEVGQYIKDEEYATFLRYIM